MILASISWPTALVLTAVVVVGVPALAMVFFGLAILFFERKN